MAEAACALKAQASRSEVCCGELHRPRELKAGVGIKGLG